MNEMTRDFYQCRIQDEVADIAPLFPKLWPVLNFKVLKSRVQHPGSRVQSPGSSIQSPAFRAQRTDSSIQSPGIPVWH